LPKLTIYSNDDCIYCRLAKRLLDERGVAYLEINLAMDADGRIALGERSGRLTFPQILIDGEPIGGYHELRQLVVTGGPPAGASLERAA
jgi:glutaredoxin 3